MPAMPTESSSPPTPIHPTLHEAFLAAQEEMPAVEPDATNPHFGSRFVSLGHLLSKARPVLHRHGLSILQAPSIGASGEPVLRTSIIHAATGESYAFESLLTPTKRDPQAMGSAITYMRRYAAAAALAVADQEDDDGNEGTNPAPQSGNADADRPAATTIPLDRARAILHSAIAAKLVTWDNEDAAPEMGSLFLAKLADVGVQLIKDLNVDQAEEVEAFIKEETNAHAARTEEEQA